MPSPNEYRSFAEEASNSAVAGAQSGSSTFFKVVLPLGGVAVAGFLIYSALNPKNPGSMLKNDREDFHTTQFAPPELDTPRPHIDQGVISVPPVPEPPTPVQQPAITIPPAPLAPPLASPQQVDDGEAKRLAELERQRLAEEERRKWERLRASQLVADAGGQGGAPANAANGDAQANAAAGAANPNNQEDDPNKKFLARSSASNNEVSAASKNPRIDALVPQGTTIRGILETAIQSDLAGMVRAVTSEDIWSFDGRRILIPSGSRLIGEYKSGISTGQTRVFIVWNRLLRADGVSVQLGSIGTDELGRSGMSGVIDNHYIERFGSAIMLSLVGGASQFIASLGQNSQASQPSTTTIYNPATGQTTTTQTQANQNNSQARQIATQQVSQSLNQIANEALKDSIKIPPTIYVDQGSRIIVFVRKDLDFSELYPDPVKQALQEIKRERRSSANNLPR